MSKLDFCRTFDQKVEVSVYSGLEVIKETKLDGDHKCVWLGTGGLPKFKIWQDEEGFTYGVQAVGENKVHWEPGYTLVD